MWGCSRLLLVWSVILCVTVDSDALHCYTAEEYESCEGACHTMLDPGHGNAFVGNGCMHERTDNGCTDVQARSIVLSHDSPARDIYAGIFSQLGIPEGKVCYCKTDGCNNKNRLSVESPPSFSDGRNGGSGFIPSVSLLLSVLCFLAWKSFAE